MEHSHNPKVVSSNLTPATNIFKGLRVTVTPFLLSVRPAGRTHLEVEVLYGP